MRVLVIGGTGLISVGIVKHLLARKADVTVFNRGQRADGLPDSVRRLHGDRNDPKALAEALAGGQTYDAVIDMVCFTPEQATAAVGVFGGKCRQFVFCSTVCTYGVKVPPGVLIDEAFPQQPISGYGKNKVACERIFERAGGDGAFATTIVRPSCTYGPGGNLNDNPEFNPVAWDRIQRGLPVLCAGDGLGLWVATHRDDCGKLFAYAVGNEKTFGQAYNATRDDNFTWRDFYRQAAKSLGQPARLLFAPAAWIVRHDPARFGLLHEITQYHGAYTSAKAERDVPAFRCEIGFEQGAAETLADMKRRRTWKSSENDPVYDGMVEQLLKLGVEPIEA